MRIVRVKQAGQAEAVRQAVRVLGRGGVVAYPTDTVYGLAARIDRPRAISAVYAIKARDRAKPLSVMVAGLSQARRLARLDKGALRAWESNMPGPYTLVLPVRARLDERLQRSCRVALRMPDHGLALDLARAAGPVTATSANRAGRGPLRAAWAVRRSFGRARHAPDLLIDAGTLPASVPSAIIDLASERVTIRRRGPAPFKL